MFHRIRDIVETHVLVQAAKKRSCDKCIGRRSICTSCVSERYTPSEARANLSTEAWSASQTSGRAKGRSTFEAENIAASANTSETGSFLYWYHDFSLANHSCAVNTTSLAKDAGCEQKTNLACTGSLKIFEPAARISTSSKRGRQTST